VTGVFFDLLFCHQLLPPGVYRLEDLDHFMKSLLSRQVAHFQDRVYFGVQLNRCLELENMPPGDEYVRSATDDIICKVPPRYLGQDDGRKRLLGPLRRPVEYKMYPLEELERHGRYPHARPGNCKNLVYKLLLPVRQGLPFLR